MHVTENIRPTAIGQASRGDDLLRFIFFLLGHIGPIIKTELLTHSYDFFFYNFGREFHGHHKCS